MACKIGRLVFRQGLGPSCRTSLISTKSTLACVSIPTCTGIACDSGDTIPYVVKAVAILIGWVGSSVGSWGNRPSLKSRRN